MLVMLTADICVFTMNNKHLHVLLVCRKKEPFRGCWALPGGRQNPEETLDDCATRELQEETGLKQVNLRHFANFSKPGRDPRGRTVSAAYIAWADNSVNIIPGSDASATKWFPVNSLPQLAFDHDQILKSAMKVLQITKEFKPA